MLISSFLSSFSLALFLLPIPFPSLLFSTNFFPKLAFLLFSLYREVLSWSTLSHLLITWHTAYKQVLLHMSPAFHTTICWHAALIFTFIERLTGAKMLCLCYLSRGLILFGLVGRWWHSSWKISSLSIPFLVCDIVRSQCTATRQRKPTLLN